MNDALQVWANITFSIFTVMIAFYSFYIKARNLTSITIEKYDFSDLSNVTLLINNASHMPVTIYQIDIIKKEDFKCFPNKVLTAKSNDLPIYIPAMNFADITVSFKETDNTIFNRKQFKRKRYQLRRTGRKNAVYYISIKTSYKSILTYVFHHKYPNE